MKYVWYFLIALICVACFITLCILSKEQEATNTPQGVMIGQLRRTQADEFGVVCYQSTLDYGALSCVKIMEKK